MAQLAYTNEKIFARAPVADWRAIWAGVFTFLAIWSVFGFLGIAIFASSSNPNYAQPALGVNVGIGIWTIILTIIAMYIAGLETGRLASVNTRHDGLVHGMIMFGLSVAAVMVLVALANRIFTTGLSTATHNPYAATASFSWTVFGSLFFGWLAAMSGASTGTGRRSKPEQQDLQPVQEVKRAA
ncbi:MAG TPA: hypothetical protein VGL74_13280 [Terriglobales bacterium]